MPPQVSIEFIFEGEDSMTVCLRTLGTNRLETNDAKLTVLIVIVTNDIATSVRTVVTRQGGTGKEAVLVLKCIVYLQTGWTVKCGAAIGAAQILGRHRMAQKHVAV